MHILLGGASGFIGQALRAHLSGSGHQLTRLVRRSVQAGEAAIPWDPAAGVLEARVLEGVEGVVHLSGEPIVGRWTAAKKRRIRESRVQSTRLLCERLAQQAQPPSVVVCASAIGYYGDRGEEILREDSGPGKGFLAELCQGWEAATQPAAQRGIRIVTVRIGIILSPAGGALKLMLPPFQLGLGGRLGHGRQYMSWVALEDVLGAIEHALRTNGLRGAVNVVAPQPVTNADFTTTLSRILRRPTIFPVPAFVLRAALGEFAEEALLASARVEPAKLLASGYPFRDPELEGALRRLLGRA